MTTALNLALLVVFASCLQYLTFADEFTTTTTTTNTNITNQSLTSISPRGLCYGLLSVALVQAFVVLPYYWMLRHDILQRPFIQSKREIQQQPFWSGLVAHLSRVEGFVLLGSYLTGACHYQQFLFTFFFQWNRLSFFFIILLLSSPLLFSLLCSLSLSFSFFFHWYPYILCLTLSPCSIPSPLLFLSLSHTHSLILTLTPTHRHMDVWSHAFLLLRVGASSATHQHVVGCQSSTSSQ